MMDKVSLSAVPQGDGILWAQLCIGGVTVSFPITIGSAEACAKALQRAVDIERAHSEENRT